ncbi:MAG: hypothetical protein EOM32_06500 [Spirochaetia bacterium]|nr:hypothetical protein [Spirochaetia bacterium]
MTHDISTGALTGIDVSVKDTNYNRINRYTMGSTEYYNTLPFLGRVVYTGPSTTLTFTNVGTIAQNTLHDQFFFTYVNNHGTSEPARWREFAILTRTKGLYHDNTQHDFSQKNVLVPHEGGSISISEGAGLEEVAPGELGYNTSGTQRTYTGSNSYKYRYPYSYIWVDIMLIRTNADNLQDGRYESLFTINTSFGNSLLMQVAGVRGDPNYEAPPSFYFTMEKTIDDDFPFSLLSSCTSPATSLPVGSCSYISKNDSATIKFASDSSGASGIYFMSNELGDTFPYYLAFDATNPDRAPAAADATTSFATGSGFVYSPIANTMEEHKVLEGTVNMYMPLDVYPNEGRYTTSIYCLITHTD